MARHPPTIRSGPGQHHLPRRQTRRHYRPKQINDPLFEALASVANEVHKVRERVQQLEGSRSPLRTAPRISPAHHGRSRPTRFSPTWTNMDRPERTSDLGRQNSDDRPLEILQPEIQCRGVRSVPPGGSPDEMDYPCCSSTSARSILFGR